jgi:hypothetical protein
LAVVSKKIEPLLLQARSGSTLFVPEPPLDYNQVALDGANLMAFSKILIQIIGFVVPVVEACGALVIFLAALIGLRTLLNFLLEYELRLLNTQRNAGETVATPQALPADGDST